MLMTMERFWIKVEKTDGCWNWLGHHIKQGYARFRYNGGPGYAHRYSYELHKGAIPPGLQIDHLCRNRGCVNPDHLRAVTVKENLATRVMCADPRKRRACNAGHPYLDGSYYMLKTGSRRCKECQVASEVRLRLRARGNVELIP